MRRLAFAAALLLAASAAHAQAPAQSPPAPPAPTAAPAPAPLPPLGQPLSLDQARAVVAAALADARARGFTMAVAAVEPNGSLVAFERMDGTQYASIEVAEGKARSSALYRRPTLAFFQSVAAGRVQSLSLPDVVAIEGGVPLVLNGRLVGAIGVSGGTSEQDGVVAAAGVAALR